MISKSAYWVKHNMPTALTIPQDKQFVSAATTINHRVLKLLEDDGYLWVVGKTKGANRHQVNIWQTTRKFKPLLRRYPE